MSKQVQFLHQGGIIGNEDTKKHNIVNLDQEYLEADALMATVLRNDHIVKYFGNKENQTTKCQAAFDHQNDEGKEARYKTFLHMNNFVQRSFFENESTVMNFDRLRKITGLEGEDVSNLNKYQRPFHQSTFALKQMSSAFGLAEIEAGEDIDEEETGEEEEAESPQEVFAEIQERSKELRSLLRGVPSAQLSKFLDMKVSHDTQTYKVIEGFRLIFKYALKIPEDEIRFKNSNLIKLYLGMPLNGIKNADRVDFINWVAQQELETEELDPEDEDISDEDLICNILAQWLEKLAELLEILKDTDLDNMKSKTIDKDNANVRKYKCNYVNWFRAPLTDECNVTMVQLTGEADINMRSFQISIIDGATLNKFNSVQISHFRGSTTFNYKYIRVCLGEYLNIENKHYVLARPLSSKSAIYCTEEDLYNDEFVNDLFVYYSLDNKEYSDVQNKVKDYLFIHLTKDFLIPLVLETGKKVGDQLEIIKDKLAIHSLNLTIDDLKTRLFWNGKSINYELPFSSFVSDNTLSHLAKSAPLFTYNPQGNQKPAYNTNPYQNPVNLRMKPFEIMRHFYGINYEDYKRQDFDLSVMGSTILAFDISIFSIRFNFVDPFSIKMEEVIRGDDDNENEYHYQPLAILTKK